MFAKFNDRLCDLLRKSIANIGQTTANIFKRGSYLLHVDHAGLRLFSTFGEILKLLLGFNNLTLKRIILLRSNLVGKLSIDLGLPVFQGFQVLVGLADFSLQSIVFFLGNFALVHFCFGFFRFCFQAFQSVFGIGNLGLEFVVFFLTDLSF